MGSLFQRLNRTPALAQAVHGWLFAMVTATALLFIPQGDGAWQGDAGHPAIHIGGTMAATLDSGALTAGDTTGDDTMGDDATKIRPPGDLTCCCNPAAEQSSDSGCTASHCTSVPAGLGASVAVHILRRLLRDGFFPTDQSLAPHDPVPELGPPRA